MINNENTAKQTSAAGRRRGCGAAVVAATPFAPVASVAARDTRKSMHDPQPVFDKKPYIWCSGRIVVVVHRIVVM
ncbi:unnamed protein product [Parnassius mnemosyne]|uniref:Uncharacterized protein n=1 Tax=Parnassius mnemosyne TaxID=213953 RepID=A0AAV1MAG8_9NEOP